MYDGDPFFTLSMTARVGLVLLSVGLAALTAWAFIRIACRWAWPIRLFLALVFLWVFVWLSPQVYYLYYMAVFDQLPMQNVVQSPPGPGELFHLLSFTGKANLSHHAQGLFGWGLIALACLGRRTGILDRIRTVQRS